jgi:hypothetical protein
MADLKPIGSEKLTGQAKLNRIMEIARYNESHPKTVNETSKSEYSISLADGNNYHIVKERQGYVIQRMVSESNFDYIEPMKNRKYYSSYSQAFKRLNLLAGELNRLNENEEGVSLYGEQKKFVLKTPKPEVQDAPPVPAAPPPVPQPELPPSPVSSDDAGPSDESPELGTDAEMGAEDMGPEGETDMEMDVDVEDMGGEEMAPDAEEKITFKTIQKLTGKLTQKIRLLNNEDGMTSEDVKYVINMVLSSLDLSNLSEEDKEDIMAKFEEAEGREENMGGEEMPGEDITSDTEVEDIQTDMDVPVDQEMGEGHGMILNNVYKESKVDKVLSKYFELSKKEILESRKMVIERKKTAEKLLSKKMVDVVKLSETVEQEMASQKFLEENLNFEIIGITNKKNLVFENGDKRIKISPAGLVL